MNDHVQAKAHSISGTQVHDCSCGCDRTKKSYKTLSDCKIIKKIVLLIHDFHINVHCLIGI